MFITTLFGKTEEWEPYVGPQGGEGWRSMETGEIVYQDHAPGPVAGDSSTRDRTGSDEDSIRPEGVGEDFLDVESQDVQRDDYVSVDGEIEGFLDNVESFRNGTVQLTFEDGRSVRVGEGDEVWINDDPPERQGESLYNELIGTIEDNVFIDYDGDFINERDVSSQAATDMSNAKNETFAKRTLSNLESITGGVRRSHFDSSDGTLQLADNVFEETVTHEIGHAFLDANGVDIPKGANLLAIVHGQDNDNRLRTDLFGQTVGEAIEQLQDEGELGDYSVPNTDEEFNADHLKLEIQDDYGDEDFNQMVESINGMLESEIDKAEKGFDLYHSYGATNGHEMFTAVHEILQGDDLIMGRMHTLYDEYPDVLESYFDVFEPGDRQKKMLNKLFNEKGPNGSIDDEPFPEVDN